MKNQFKEFVLPLIAMILLAGCTASRRGNEGQMNIYPVAVSEAKWIRSGEPIEFEDEKWYPQDGIETLLDSEVILLGEFREVQIFVDKVDVRPYQRLYSKFGKNKFRYFIKEEKLP